MENAFRIENENENEWELFFICPMLRHPDILHEYIGLYSAHSIYVASFVYLDEKFISTCDRIQFINWIQTVRNGCFAIDGCILYCLSLYCVHSSAAIIFTVILFYFIHFYCSTSITTQCWSNLHTHAHIHFGSDELSTLNGVLLLQCDVNPLVRWQYIRNA